MKICYIKAAVKQIQDYFKFSKFSAIIEIVNTASTANAKPKLKSKFLFRDFINKFN